MKKRRGVRIHHASHPAAATVSPPSAVEIISTEKNEVTRKITVSENNQMSIEVCTFLFFVWKHGAPSRRSHSSRRRVFGKFGESLWGTKKVGYVSIALSTRNTISLRLRNSALVTLWRPGSLHLQVREGSGEGQKQPNRRLVMHSAF